MKSNKGITLVALVITIIVLLILAGVSISLVVGDNGVLTQAQSASKNTNQASADNAMDLSLSSISTNFMATTWKDDTNAKIYNYVTVNELEKELENYGFKIYKLGSLGDPTNADKNKYIDGTDSETSSSEEKKDILVYIYDKKASDEDIKAKNMTIYKYTLNFKTNGTVVSAISNGIVDNKGGI